MMLFLRSLHVSPSRDDTAAHYLAELEKAKGQLYSAASKPMHKTFLCSKRGAQF